MLITKLIIQTFLTKLFPRIVLEKNIDKIQEILKLSSLNKRTVCYIANHESEIYHDVLIKELVSVVVIDSERTTQNIKLCQGYVMSTKNITDFLKILTYFNFPPHRRMLLFLEENYLATFLIELKVYELALSLIVIHGLSDATMWQNNELDLKLNIFFAMKNESKILGKDKIEQNDFSTKWTPKLWSNIGRKVRVSFFHCPPYVMVKYRKNNTEYGLTGIDFNIYQGIAKDWPVEFILEEEKKNIRDNLFLKVIENVVSNESDIAMCGLWQRVILESKIDMSKYNSAQCITFLVAKPQVLGDMTFVFQPFSDFMWLSLLAVLMLMLVFKSLFGSYATVSNNSALVVISHLSSGPTFPKSSWTSVNILYQFWSLFCMLTLIYYSAGLTKSLRFPRFSRNINSFEDMVNYQTRWEEPTPDIQRWFLNTNYTLYRKIGQLFTLGSNRTILNEHLRTGNYAFLVKVVDNHYVMNGEYLNDFGRSNLKIIPECAASFYTVFAFQKNSPFVEVFNRELPRFLEHGFVEHWQRIYSAAGEVGYMRNFFKNWEAEVRQKIDFSKMIGVFCFLVCGYVAAVVVFVLEAVLYNNKYLESIVIDFYRRLLRGR